MRGCSFFRDYDDAELQALSTTCALVSFKRGDYVWHRGEEARTFYHIVSGLVELRRATPSFEVNLMAFFGPTESPGLPVVLQRGRYGADGVAASSGVTVLAIQAEPMLARVQHDARVANAVNRGLLGLLRLLHGKIDVMAAGTVARRLALFFLNLANRFGDEHEHGETIIPIGLSRAQIATYIDARVETVIRALSQWKKDGTVTVYRDRIVVPDIAALQRALSD
jgi:CRP-like cAMP-binding protein